MFERYRTAALSAVFKPEKVFIEKITLFQNLTFRKRKIIRPGIFCLNIY